MPLSSAVLLLYQHNVGCRSLRRESVVTRARMPLSGTRGYYSQARQQRLIYCVLDAGTTADPAIACFRQIDWSLSLYLALACFRFEGSGSLSTTAERFPKG